MKRLLILSGAGVSAESGIKTFRDSDGLWENYPVEDVACIEAWYRNPSLVLQFYNERRAQLEHAKPNKAHLIIASLEKHFEVCVVTQNIDNLHERAGSSHVIHLHGESTKVRPENTPANGKGVIDIGYKAIHMGDTDEHGIQLRPHIVWFGEEVPMMTQAIEEVEKANIMLIIGTSLAVYPAAGLIHYAKPGTKIFLIDPKPIHVSGIHITQIQKVATEGMQEFQKLMMDEDFFEK